MCTRAWCTWAPVSPPTTPSWQFLAHCPFLAIPCALPLAHQAAVRSQGGVWRTWHSPHADERVGPKITALLPHNTHTHAQTYTHTRAYASACKHTHTCACMHTHMHARTHTHARTRTHTHTHTRTHTHIHARAHTHTHTHSHTRAHIHAHLPQGLTHRPFTSQLVKGGDKIDLGQGHVMEFVMAPNLHWYARVHALPWCTHSCMVFACAACACDASPALHWCVRALAHQSHLGKDARGGECRHRRSSHQVQGERGA